MSDLEWLGSGKFGNVWGKGDSAIKVVTFKLNKPHTHGELIREAVVCNQIRFFQERNVSGSQNVVRFLGASLEIVNNEFVFRLEMARAHGGSLFDIIKDPGFKASPNFIGTYVAELTAGLAFCHFTCGILVRDLSPNNVLVTSIETPQFWLADFGKSRPLTDNLVDVQYSDGYHGAPIYQPPRAFLGYDRRTELDINFDWRFADWYSLGVVAITACNPHQFWSQVPEHSGEKNMDSAYFEFARGRVPLLLAAACQTIHESDSKVISRWVRRELDLVEPCK